MNTTKYNLVLLLILFAVIAGLLLYSYMNKSTGEPLNLTPVLPSVDISKIHPAAVGFEHFSPPKLFDPAITTPVFAGSW